VSQLEKWERLAARWEHQGPPATPSFDDINNFSEALQGSVNCDTPTIAVLGCTPSLRTRMRRDWPTSRIIVVDFCQEMYVATSVILDQETKDAEEYYPIDWLGMASELKYEVDAFVGDKSLDNVAFEDWSKFFQSAFRCARPEGLLVLHVGFPDPELAGKPFETLAQPWIDHLSLNDTDVETGNAAAGLWEDLLSGSVSDSTNHLSLEPYRSALEEHNLSNTPIGLLSTRILKDFASQLDAQWTRFDQSDVIQSAREYGFEFLSQKYSHDYHAARNQPVMVFRQTAPR